MKIKVWTTSGLAEPEEGEEILSEMRVNRDKRHAILMEQKIEEANAVAAAIIGKKK